MNFGILSIIPPLVAIILALTTKEVITSLLVGIFVGGLIFTGGDIISAVEEVFTLMGKKLGSNAMMLVFLVLLGSLVMVINLAGGSFAYGKWASKKIKSKRSAKLAAAILGMLIFIDDYFNCLTVGAVMRPIIDENKVSRAKLAQLIDSTAAPVCILAPISSWAASVVAVIGDTGLKNPMGIFISTIPLNLYALLTLISVFYFTFSSKEIGIMEKFENSDTSRISESVDLAYDYSDKGKVIDLIIPILTLISVTIIEMLKTGGYFDGEIGIGAAFGEADVNLSLVIGSVVSLIVSFVMYIPRKLVTFNEFMDGVVDGMKTMISPIVILSLAWTIGGITSIDYLNTAGYISDLITKSSMSMTFLPSIIFVVAAFLSFSTGTAWGTFGILIPIMVPILVYTNSLEILSITIAAIFSGSVFGDHCSPISDTTILSSAGAECRHIDHVSSQLPYALICGVSSGIGFLFASLLNNHYLSLPIALILMITAFEIAKRNNRESLEKGIK